MSMLGENFFSRGAVTVAKALLGATLVRRRGKKEIRCRIVETEAYDGFCDRASHASRGKTERNSAMFGPAGHWYVYFTYGMHWMLNVVTREEKYPAAVLIRGGVLENGTEINGPARLTKFLHIDGKINKKLADKRSGLWIEDKEASFGEVQIEGSRRIGVDFAGTYWARRKLRFYIKKQF